jgi:hypothetical protein
MPKLSNRLVRCLDNSGYDASLERGKTYVVIPDLRAERLGQIRITDDSGEDYLRTPGTASPLWIWRRQRGRRASRLSSVEKRRSLRDAPSLQAFFVLSLD